MKLLLDTHSFLWFINGDTRLSSKGKNLILKTENEIFVSIVSLLEVVLKTNIGKLTLASDFDSLFLEIEKNNFQLMQISRLHLNKLNTLILHHRDPFDRLLIAQGISEKMRIVTKDSNFSKYNIEAI